MKVLKLILLAAVVTCASATSIHAQSNVELANYAMEISVQDSTISIKCTGGCNWTTLSTANDGKPKVISADGIAKVEDGVPQSDFIFVLYKKKKQLELMSLTGSAWTQLRMSCTSSRCSYHVDQNGMSH
jgi:hypothetical protein